MDFLERKADKTQIEEVEERLAMVPTIGQQK